MTVQILCSEKVGLRERQRRDRDEAILQGMFVLIAEKGYEALTMEDLAERVGISRQTIYHHFCSKEDLALRAILRLVEDGIQAIQQIAADSQLSPGGRFERVIRSFLEMRFSPTPAAFVKVRPSLVPIRAHPDYKKAFDRRAEAIAQVVETAQAAGEITNSLPSSLIVQMLFGLAFDASYETLISQGETSPEEVTEAILTLFFHGLRPKEGV